MNEAVINIDGQSVSLADLMGVDISQIEAVRATLPPEGVYQLAFDGVTPSIEESYTEGNEGRVLQLTLTHKVAHIHSLVDKQIDPADWIGKTFDKRFRDDVAKVTFGKFKAHCEDAKLTIPTPFELANASAVTNGYQFVVKLTHGETKQKQKYIQLDMANAKAVQAQQVTQPTEVAAAAAPAQSAQPAVGGIVIGGASAG